MGEQNSGLGAANSKDKSYIEGEMKQEEEKQERKKVNHIMKYILHILLKEKMLYI